MSAANRTPSTAHPAARMHRVKVIKIESCKDSLVWYSHLVGQYVPLEGVDVESLCYRSREPAGFVNFVHLEDARPMTLFVSDQQVGKWPYLVRVGLLGDTAAPASPERPTGQSRAHSAIETAVNIGVGFVLSLVITAVVMPMFGHQVTASENVAITSIFTVASLARSYALRRLFNRWSVA